MSSIFDYLKWRGDIAFDVSPFNPVDNLILSELAYALWDEIVDSSFDDEIRLEDAVNLYFERQIEEKQLTRAPSTSGSLVEMLRMLKETDRFRNLRLCGFQMVNNYEVSEQFAAVTFVLPDETVFVSYRGTDDTILGWKEDLDMSFKSFVPGQNKAREYLHNAMIHFDTRFRVGGHSKGGNLAVYASAFIPSVLQSRIINVYNNDGPGFLTEIYDNECFKRIDDRILTFVPQSSIIGMLLEHDEDFKIVHSSETGISQHNVFTWEVNVNDLVYLDANTFSSKLVDKSLKNWVNDLDYDQKQKFFEAVFGIIDETGITSMTELRNISIKQGYSLFKTYMNSDDETKGLIATGFGYLAKSLKDNIPMPQIPNIGEEIKKIRKSKKDR